MERNWRHRIAFILLFFGILSQAQIMPAVVDYDNYAVKKRYLDFRGLVSGTIDHVQRDTQVVTTQSFTVECWVKMDDPSTPQNNVGQWLINERGDGGNGSPGIWNYQLIWFKSDKRFTLYVRNSANNATYQSGITADSTGLNIQANTWYHVAGVCDYNAAIDTLYLTVYVNGIAGTTTANYDISGRTIDSGAILRMGYAGFNAPAVNFTELIGSLDEVRIWDHARTAEQINRYKDKRLRCKETGLVAYYRMNEGTGNVVGDCAGTADDATRVNAPWVTN